MARETFIANPGERDFPTIVPGKADFLRNGREKAGSVKIVREKDRSAVRAGLLTGNRAEDPADSVTATNLSSNTGRGPVRTAKVVSLKVFGNFFPQPH
jgi:hypothetical protein